MRVACQMDLVSVAKTKSSSRRTMALCLRSVRRGSGAVALDSGSGVLLATLGMDICPRVKHSLVA